VPQALTATAQALYGAVGIGLASAAVTLAAGWLYGRLGGSGFYVMPMLCSAALPVSIGLLGRDIK
jgi:MFS transporter, PPP family, 3-phenylpropionic acid transporter